MFFRDCNKTLTGTITHSMARPSGVMGSRWEDLENYRISGGTGRFTGASRNLRMTATIMPVLGNASNAPALLTNTGKFEGTIFGAALEDEEREDER